jgi:2-polyprenyl-3-methyl-5-hydroxy-6-metoxy-1,4-benzoquinol methylase
VEPRGGPDPFHDTFVAMAGARAVITATRLGVLSALSEERARPDALSAKLNLDPIGIEALLTALATLGYLEAGADGTYGPTAAGLRLADGASDSVAHFVGAYNAHAWEMLGGLDEALRGQRRPVSHQRPPGDPFWESYIRGLFELTRDEHDEAARQVPVSEPHELLDVAGGHGGFAMAMCARHPRLKATVLDLPASAAVGRRIVAKEGFEQRISFREGDATEADLGEHLDVISIFNLLHHLPPPSVQALLGRAHSSLLAGGCLVVGETERTEQGESASLNGAMSGLVYFASSGTRNYTRRELAGWLEQAGFSTVDVHRSEASPWRLLYLARA